MRPTLALLLAGCTPHDAEVDGKWTVWLSANSSQTIEADAINLDGVSHVDCAKAEDEIGYIGSSDDAPSCDDVAELTWQTWLQDDGFYTLQDDLVPWRTDALINGEGDFQLTIHQDLGKGEDFRFAFSIDPDFAPSDCISDESGNLELTYQDGASWLEKWSEDEGDYTIYYLNAGAYQYNPQNTSSYWSFETSWLSGIGVAKFSEDDFYSYGVDYSWTDPNYPVYVYCEDSRSGSVLLDECMEWDTIDDRVAELKDGGAKTSECPTSAASYNTRLLYYSGWYSPYCEDGPAVQTPDVLRDSVAEEVLAQTATFSDEMTRVYGADTFDLRVEDNSWREIDAADQGLDGWIDLQTSWVRVKKGSDLTVGGAAEGDFQIYFYGAESNSHAVVHGTFKIDKIKEDKWAYDDLDAVKREENGTEYCGGATL